MRPIEKDLIYGEARGSEQYNIEKHKTRTGKIGEEISSTNQGNKYNSLITIELILGQLCLKRLIMTG